MGIRTVNAQGLMPLARDIFWLVALATPLLTVAVPVGAGRVLSVTAFDLLILVTFIAICRPFSGGLTYRAAAGLWPLLAFATLAACHSAATLAFGTDLQLPGLVRETIKYLGFAANVAMLALILKASPLAGAPSAVALATASVAIGGTSALFVLTPLHFAGGSYVTVIGAVLTAIALLLAAADLRGCGRRDRVAILIGLAFALIGVWSIWSKYFLLAIAGCIVGFALQNGARRLSLGTVAAPRLALLCGVALTLFLGWLYVTQGWRIDSSVDARLALWRIAAELAAASFPSGIGLGQFGAALAEIPEYQGEGQLRFAHNQFLSFVTEAGAIGIALGILLVKIIFDAARAWDGLFAIIFVCILLGALLLHDALGLRAIQLLTGFSLAFVARAGVGGPERPRLA